MSKKDKFKMFYSMGEISEMFDVNPSLIRYWEGKFDILRPHKNKKGNRMFTPEDVDNLKIIYHLVKEKGMTLEGADRRIKSNKEAIGRDMDVVDRLLSIKSTLLEIRQELTIGRDEKLDQRADYDGLSAQHAEPKAQQEVEMGIAQETEMETEQEFLPEQSDVEFLPERSEGGFLEFDADKTEYATTGLPDFFTDQQLTIYGEEELLAEEFIDEESISDHNLVTSKVESVIETQQTDIELEPEYMAHLLEEIAQEADIAAEVMETLSAIDGEEQKDRRPEVYEQTLF